MPSCQFLVAATCSIAHLGHNLLLFFFAALSGLRCQRVGAPQPPRSPPTSSATHRHRHDDDASTRTTTNARPTTPPLLPLPSSSASSRPTSCLRLHLVYHHRRCIPHHPGPVSHTNRATPN